MRIAVLIKQVPGTTKVEIDPVTGTLKRDGVAAKMNPYDLFALECALELKGRFENVSVVALTMGPPQAADVIREAVYMGCESGTVVSDRKFAGSDVLATSRTIAAGIKALGRHSVHNVPRLIICGKQTTDGDTAQVGPEVAEHLGIPHVANVLAVKELCEDYVVVDANMGDYDQTLRIPLPALLTIEKDVNTPRLPSVKRAYELSECQPDELVGFFSLAAFEDNDPAHYGLSGSPTQVQRIFPPEVNADKTVHTGTSEELAAVLDGELKKMKLL